MSQKIRRRHRRVRCPHKCSLAEKLVVLVLMASFYLAGAAEKPGMMVGLVSMAAAVALAAIALGVVLIHRKCGRSSPLA